MIKADRTDRMLAACTASSPRGAAVFHGTQPYFTGPPEYRHDMKPVPLIIAPQAAGAPGTGVRGSHLAIQDWPATGVAHEVAPLHVHGDVAVRPAGPHSVVRRD